MEGRVTQELSIIQSSVSLRLSPDLLLNEVVSAVSAIAPVTEPDCDAG